jgi:hypothetical protein
MVFLAASAGARERIGKTTRSRNRSISRPVLAPSSPSRAARRRAKAQTTQQLRAAMTVGGRTLPRNPLPHEIKDTPKNPKRRSADTRFLVVDLVNLTAGRGLGDLVFANSDGGMPGDGAHCVCPCRRVFAMSMLTMSARGGHTGRGRPNGALKRLAISQGGV